MRADELRWWTVPVRGGLGHPDVALQFGEIGSGGPVGLLVAGVHGDEGPWALLAIRRLLDTLSLGDVVGTLRVLPSANPLAVQIDQRENELDRLDLNSSFPGSDTGSHTERLAAAITSHGLNGADFVLDVHGGGSWNINCFAYQLRGSEELARWLGTTLVADAPDRATSLSGHAVTLGAKAVWIEAGGRGAHELSRAEELAAGLRHALGRAQVLTPSPQPEKVPGYARLKDRVVNSVGGIYVPELGEDALGTTVPQGTVIGKMLDPVTGEVVEEYRAPYPQTTLALLRPSVACIDSPGKALAVVASL
jgi:predicted deacylase